MEPGGATRGWEREEMAEAQDGRGLYRSSGSVWGWVAHSRSPVFLDIATSPYPPLPSTHTAHHPAPWIRLAL